MKYLIPSEKLNIIGTSRELLKGDRSWKLLHSRNQRLTWAAAKDEEMKFDECDIPGALTLKVKENWLGEKTCPPEFLPLFSKDQKQANETRLSEAASRLRKQITAFSHVRTRKKQWKNEMEQLLCEMVWMDPMLRIEKAMTKESFTAFEEEMKALVRRVRRFDPKLTMEELGQALRNYMVYAVFLELNGLPQKCTANIFGYSMLYPYTDNYVDAPNRSKEELHRYNRMIADQIQGESYDAVTNHDRRTIELLSLAQESYARPDDGYGGLLLMLEAQQESQKQNDREHPPTEDETLVITLLKGGVSVLLDRYFIGLPLTEKDYHFYYEFGFLLQLCDDLQDISSDQQSGCHTVFSACRSKEETVRNVNRLIHRMKRLFDAYECAREPFKEFLLRNCLLLILCSAAASREYMTEKWLVWLEERLPVSMDYLQKIARSDFHQTLGRSNRELMKMVDVFCRKTT